VVSLPSRWAVRVICARTTGVSRGAPLGTPAASLTTSGDRPTVPESDSPPPPGANSDRLGGGGDRGLWIPSRQQLPARGAQGLHGPARVRGLRRAALGVQPGSQLLRPLDERVAPSRGLAAPLIEPAPPVSRRRS
jgi:hypothetical protein